MSRHWLGDGRAPGAAGSQCGRELTRLTWGIHGRDMEQQVHVLGSCIRAPSIHALAAELQGRVLLVAGTNAADVAPDTTHKAQMLPSFFYRLDSSLGRPRICKANGYVTHCSSATATTHCWNSAGNLFFCSAGTKAPRSPRPTLWLRASRVYGTRPTLWLVDRVVPHACA